MPTPIRIAAALLAACLLQTATLAADPFGEWRGLWINRFEYSPNSVSSIESRIAGAAAMGITDVMWQVRGQSDALYESQFETPAQSWNQSIDPLQVAIDAAHANGVRLHAWVNTMPVWNGASAPTNPNHVFYNTEPSFRVTDIHGNPEPLGGGYVKVNHVLPEVQSHINNVVADLASNYDLDGIHLDYVRWLGPNAGSSEGYKPDWNYLPHDADAHALYFQETGLNAADGSTLAKRDAYRNWVQGKITQLVSSIGDTVDAIESASGRDIVYSAAVWNNPTTARNQYLQDYRAWLQQDLLDMAMPMVYLSASNNYLMDGFLDDIFATPTNTKVSIGLGSYLHTASGGGVEETIAEMNQVYNDGRASSLSFYGYGSVLDGSSISSQRRDAIINWYNALDAVEPPVGGVPAPGSTVITGFDAPGDEGYFASSITAGGQTTISASSSADQTNLTAHRGGGSQRLDIDAGDGWTLRHLSGGATPAGNLAFAADGYVGFWLKTETPGLTVQVALDDPSTADRGVLRQVIPDGQWRLYEWNLDDESQWEGWVSGDGVITGPTVTLDSIFLYGSGDALVYLDTVAHNPSGSLYSSPVPGDYDGDGMVSPADYAVWRDSYGQSGEGLAADGNGDGTINAADYTVWRDALAATVVPIPEPATLLLAVSAMLAGTTRSNRLSL